MRALQLLQVMTLATGFSLGIMSMGYEVAKAESSAEERAMAEALFRDGKALMNAGNPAEACPKLAESQRLDPGGGTQLLLGLCLESAGQLASAWVELNEALSMAQRDENEVRERLAREHIDALWPRLSRIELIFEVGGPTQGLVIKRDGAEVPRAAWSTALPLDAGSHLMTFEAEGYETARLEIEIFKEGSTIPVNVPLLRPIEQKLESIPVVGSPREDLVGRETTPKEEPSTSPSSRRVAAYVLGGVGVAAIAAGSVFGIRAISLNNQVENACPEPSCDQMELEDEYSDSRSAATWSTVLFGVGLAGVATGVYLLLTDSSSASSSNAGSRTSVGVNQSSSHLLGNAQLDRFDLSATPLGGTLVVGGSF